MDISPALCPIPHPIGSYPPRERACALLACLEDYSIGVEPLTSEAHLGYRSDPASEHDRETRRLIALLTTHLSAPVAARPVVSGPAALTRREVEVLDGVAEGLSTIEIAGVLHISVNTARNHVQRILEKLGVHSRVQAVNMAARHGLLQSRRPESGHQYHDTRSIDHQGRPRRCFPVGSHEAPGMLTGWRFDSSPR